MAQPSCPWPDLQHELGGVKCGKRSRVYLGKTTRKVIWRDLVDREGSNDPDAPVFLDQHGRHFNPGSLRQLIEDIADCAEVKDAYPHKFRHTFAISYLRSCGGMINDNGSPTLTDVTFNRNTANYYGGGMFNDWYSSPTLTNIIMRGDNAPSRSEINNVSSTPTIAYSDIQGCGGSSSWNSVCGTDGGSNLDTDPHFVDIPSVPDTGSGSPPVVEMGTYETQFNLIFLPLIHSSTP